MRDVAAVREPAATILRGWAASPTPLILRCPEPVKGPTSLILRCSRSEPRRVILRCPEPVEGPRRTHRWRQPPPHPEVLAKRASKGHPEVLAKRASKGHPEVP